MILNAVTSVAVDSYVFLGCKKLTLNAEQKAKLTGSVDTLFGHNA